MPEEAPLRASGSPEFLTFVSRQEARRSRRSLFTPETSLPEGSLGVFESAAGEGQVRVRLDSTEEVVAAELRGFAPDFRFEPGDELGVELVDGQWWTIPHVSHAVRRPDRVEFWTTNRRTGAFRLLCRSSHYQPQQPNPSDY